MATKNNRRKKPAKKAAKKQVKRVTKKQAKKTTRKTIVIPKKAISKPAITGAVTTARTTTIRRGAVDERTTLNTLYILDGSDNEVELEVNVGDVGQTSDMSIDLDGKILADKIAGDFEKTSLGTNKQLHGKKLNIVATIADLSRETNLTSLTIHLKGGIEPNDIPLFKTVDDEGDSADYMCVVKFFDPLA